MRIDRADIIRVQNPFLHPFETSFTKFVVRDALLVRLASEGEYGWGECKAFHGPYYNAEDNGTALHVLKNLILPRLVGRECDGPEAFLREFRYIKGNRLAKAAVENALWELRSRFAGKTLKTLIGGTSKEVIAGISIGIQKDEKTLVEKVGKALEAGYHRVKIKIRPGTDVTRIGAVRKAFGDIPLTVDANSAYTLRDIETLRAIDDFGLEYIEQPLGDEDLLDHAELQKALRTDICLDESVSSYEAAEAAIRLGSCRVINIKSSRVGGISEGIRIHDLAVKNGIRVWCGGMTELGIGRAQNIAFASLPGFAKMAHDLAGSSRFFARDIVTPEIRLTDSCMMVVPDEENGIRYEVDTRAVDDMTVAHWVVRP